ncbi:ABC transporter substrate-binding protein [Deinococcus yavapaiensis]|uniref:Trehalose/maltose transport system substrate-binding protein n=1 Tax=Deinococcus yavapaiensis KR-236 TaxID=694435 RepID=A0A318S885_9DEIO|nr:ABC transporter substrate-binding protein [Deinococcus yavapaiensis]PYE54745.1 trehalose/maltose transport system substrate-binding protein [Deinococcus yavapaiensis KR-236]
MKKALTVGLTFALSALGAASAQGVTITIACGAVGQELEFCRSGSDAWAKKTGNTVKILQSPNLTNDRLGLYQQQLAARSSDIDVYQMDVIWPGLLAQHFIDLKQYIPAAEVNAHFPAIIRNNTIGGKLVGMPWFTDAGVLYYRTDLLQKYGFKNPPKTWAELERQARTIQAGERKSNNRFVGFVFQGRNYEGLACDALEWISSFGGGSVIDANGNVTINNAGARNALRTAASWVGTIAPSGVTTYDEEAARNVFQAGNAAFMRNWPYAWALAQGEGSAVRSKVGVVALPAGTGTGARSAGTLGGWQLGVSAYSRNQKVAADLVRYLTGREEQKRRAVEGSYNPTIAALYKDQDVLKAVPFFGSLYNVFTNAVARPSSPTASKYNQVSNQFASAVYAVLTKRQTPEQALSGLQTSLTRLKGAGFR